MLGHNTPINPTLHAASEQPTVGWELQTQSFSLRSRGLEPHTGQLLRPASESRGSKCLALKTTPPHPPHPPPANSAPRKGSQRPPGLTHLEAQRQAAVERLGCPWGEAHLLVLERRPERQASACMSIGRPPGRVSFWTKTGRRHLPAPSPRSS